mmetsp:Transcript_87473/g.271720  ORF Transcript_87473/g.271720 Transcript_87473/m.271720 type:complete len:204 (+) Transcript_87473:965-1576(+)
MSGRPSSRRTQTTWSRRLWRSCPQRSLASSRKSCEAGAAQWRATGLAAASSAACWNIPGAARAWRSSWARCWPLPASSAGTRSGTMSCSRSWSMASQHTVTTSLLPSVLTHTAMRITLAPAIWSRLRCCIAPQRTGVPLLPGWSAAGTAASCRWRRASSAHSSSRHSSISQARPPGWRGATCSSLRPRWRLQNLARGCSGTWA